MPLITLTAVFEGTIYNIEEPNTHLHHVLNTDAEGIQIRSIEELNAHPEATHFKIGFNGCGVDYGIQGLLFGSGLDVQYKQVAEIVKELIKQGHQVKLNAIGLSRGGVASLLLAKQLAKIDKFHLETNLLLLDPVPGNLFLTPILDYFNLTLANQALDVSSSRNLTFVEALYPYLEVGDDSGKLADQVVASFHIPIRPTYPQHCEVKEEVILGAHLNAFQDLSTIEQQTRAVHGVDTIPIIRQLSLELINKFLQRVGALSEAGQQTDVSVIASRFAQDPERWNVWLDSLKTRLLPKDRPLHSLDDSRLSANPHGLYINKIHREVNANTTNNPTDLCLKVTPVRLKPMIESLPVSKDLLLGLITYVENAMTLTSRANSKGHALIKIGTELQSEFEFNTAQLSFVLRDIIKISLQRDRFAFSIFTTTNSGYALVDALNSPVFRPLRLCVKPDDTAIIYEDLSSYVLGRTDLSHFNASNKDENLEPILEGQVGEDRFGSLIR